MDAPELPTGLTRADERRQTPSGDRSWAESWYFDFTTPDAELGGYVQVVLVPSEGRCWYWAWVVGPGRLPVMVVDHHVPLPAGRSLELRTEGLWADHTVEVPFDHVTLGCEAFALRLDDPLDALAADPVGDRIPFGLDLEWDTAGRVEPLATTTASTVTGGVGRVGGVGGAGGGETTAPSGYAIGCRVHGEVLVADERLVIEEATGYRSHAWGVEGPWTSSEAGTTATGTLSDGTSFRTRIGAGSPESPGEDGVTPGRLSVVRQVAVQGGHLAVEPLAFAPVLAPSGGGPHRVVRALCRYVAETTGHTGAGWLERHEPA